MLSVAMKQALRKKLGEYEGDIPYMYLDSNGNVTIGVGHLLANVAQAQKLPFVEDTTKKKATATEIKDEFDNLKKQAVGGRASHYKKYTRLMLLSNDIDVLTNKDIDSCYHDLKLTYTNFDSFPDDAKLALFDMMYNLGMHKMKTAWPNFTKAIKAHDWKTAARESHRMRPISTFRNNYVKGLFDKAAAHTLSEKSAHH